MDGGSDEFGEVKVPLWIEEMFGVETVTRSKLTQIYTTFIGLHQFQQRNILCDVNITVENTVFPAHKAILAASSSFFRTMFTSSFQESRESDVSVTGKPEAFKIILDYIYSCELTLSVETVVDVLEMSHYLQLDLVIKQCEQYLIDKLNNGVEMDTKEVVRSLATARTYELVVLSEAAKRYIAKKFAPTDNFLDLMTGELLEEILGRNDLNDEKQVFDTILAWLQHDWNERKQFGPALFCKIRLGIVPVGHLSKTFLKYPKLYAITECRELIDKALDLLDARKSEDPPLHFTEPDLFATRAMINAILIFDTNFGYYYDIDTKSWVLLTKFPELPEKDSNNTSDSCLSMDGHLYVSRGTESLPRKLKCPQFLRLDMPNNRWLPLQPMNNRRHDTCLVAGRHKIYAIGGDLNFGVISVEVYNIHTNTWGPLPSLRLNNGPRFCKLMMESCKVYQDKLLVYEREKNNREGVHRADTSEEQHYLKMYDPSDSQLWTTLMEAAYNIKYHGQPEAVIIGLVINADKCYRVFCNPGKRATVHEIVIDFEGKTAREGEKQKQGLMKIVVANEKKNMAFRVNQDVYVVHNKQFFKTGIKIPRNRTDSVELGSWENLKHTSLLQPLLLAQHLFDKQKWL